MAAQHGDDEGPEAFRRAIASLRAVTLRPEVVVAEAPAPQRLAPFSLALTADVVVEGSEIASGRLVLLHDPAGHETWQGVFRLVTYVRAELEPEMAQDPLLPGVGWAWLIESLDGRGAQYCAPSGTVTRVASESFGAMSERPGTAEVEIRASWTPVDEALGPHLAAWSELLCATAGLPPVPAGVVALPTRTARPRRPPRGRGR
jgi:hypothetical protein